MDASCQSAFPTSDGLNTFTSMVPCSDVGSESPSVIDVAMRHGFEGQDTSTPELRYISPEVNTCYKLIQDCKDWLLEGSLKNYLSPQVSRKPPPKEQPSLNIDQWTQASEK